MSDTSGSEPSAPEAAPNIARTDEDIKVAADKWCENPIEAEAIYGHISFLAHQVFRQNHQQKHQ